MGAWVHFSLLRPSPLTCCFWIGGSRQKTEAILKNLQKQFRGNLTANMQSLTLVTQIPTCMGCPEVAVVGAGRGERRLESRL
jgi:hypothetical protein